MISLILGGSGCGKSAYAEKKICELAAGKETIYYLATMQVYGEEGRKKVQRHIDLRLGKGMQTIEQTRNVSDCIPKLQEGPSAILLEDLGNLVANEKFLEDGSMLPWESVAEKIVTQLRELTQNCSHLVIVSNNVFEDGISYEEGTMAYIRALGKIHQEISKDAAQVTEVVVGIPVAIKG
ncbi:MAG: bifunctional adenosylcobinamide kinase/adenosylcobinamide-phosphate guanylyltransferase [Lachnospiraceae bacterium]|nr:bifunctional adenosylcobinamide kinase/adenosylcobinamide-phosphate guanylyltransferase [Lachnospiraceae bacterium]